MAEALDLLILDSGDRKRGDEKAISPSDLGEG